MDNPTENFTYEFPEMNPRQRMWELILHIAKASIYDGKYGKTKLYKILYKSDFTAFRLLGRPITGAKYVRLLNGPIPDNIDELLSDMVASGDAKWEARPIPDRKPQMRVVAQREPDYTLFSARDIAFVDEVIRDLWNSSGTDAADETHGIVFQVLQLKEAIPYEASIISDDPITEEDIVAARELANKHGWSL
jgi:hypothetical protein